jgi:hypothetical protein
LPGSKKLEPGSFFVVIQAPDGLRLNNVAMNTRQLGRKQGLLRIKFERDSR